MALATDIIVTGMLAKNDARYRRGATVAPRNFWKVNERDSGLSATVHSNKYDAIIFIPIYSLTKLPSIFIQQDTL